MKETECGSAQDFVDNSNTEAMSISTPSMETGSESCPEHETASFPETDESGFSEATQSFPEGDLSETDAMSGQEIAEDAHEMTKSDVVSEYGQYMSEEQIAMLESEETKERITVMSSEEYTEQFSDVDINVLGHCDPEGNIYMKDISPEVVEHVSTHETMHLCSYRENVVDDDGTHRIVSGLRESRYYEDGSSSDLNRGINEGTTEMYTLRELRDRNEAEAADSLNSYTEARMWSERLESLVGDEKVSAAYFGGDREALRTEFNRLNNGDPKAWENYSRDIDILQYSNDPQRVEQAKWRLMSQYSTMAYHKYGITEV